MSRQDEASHTSARELPEIRADELSRLEIASILNIKMELANTHRPISMPLPPHIKELHHSLTAGIALLRLTYPLNGILAAERQQRVANPPAPLLEAAERQSLLDVGCKPAPSPNGEKRSQKFGTSLHDLFSDVDLERTCLRILGAWVKLHRDEAPSQVLGSRSDRYRS